MPSISFCIKTLTGHREWVRMVRVYHDGTLIASCSVDHVSSIVLSSTEKVKSSLRRYESGHCPVENVKVNYVDMTMSLSVLPGHLSQPGDRSPNPSWRMEERRSVNQPSAGIAAQLLLLSSSSPNDPVRISSPAPVIRLFACGT